MLDKLSTRIISACCRMHEIMSNGITSKNIREDTSLGMFCGNCLLYCESLLVTCVLGDIIFNMGIRWLVS